MSVRVFTAAHAAHDSTARVAVLLRDRGPQLPDDLRRSTGLPAAELHDTLDELVGLEVVVPTRDGRYRFGSDGALVVGVDVGPHTTRLALCDLSGHVVHEVRRPTGPPGPVLARIRNLVTLLRDELRAAGAGPASVQSLGFAVPARIGRDGRVVESVLLPDWSGADLAGQLSEALDGVPVHLANDGTLSAVAEASQGAGHLSRDFVNVCVGRRLSIRQVLAGHPYEGVDRLAGSVVHTFGERIDDHGRISWNGTDRGDLVVERALRGDPGSVAQIDDVVAGLADGMAESILLVNPETVVLGGSIGSRLGPWLDGLASGIRERVGGCPVQVQVRLSPLGPDSVLAGATVLALELGTSALLGRTVPAPVLDRWADATAARIA